MILPPPPVEKFKVQDKVVYVVRDGMTSPFPGPNNSKIRGVYRKLMDLREQGVKAIASQDTRISRCGWGVSYVAKELGMTHYNFYNRQGAGKPLPFYQRMSEYHDGILIPMRGNHAPIVRMHAKKYLAKHNIDAHFLPIGLSLPESVTENADVVTQLPKDIFSGSLVSCISSGTILSGVLLGLSRIGADTKVYGVLASNFKRRGPEMMKKIRNASGEKPNLLVHPARTLREAFGMERKGVLLELINPEYGYHEKIPLPPPFPCDVYLDRKAWKFIVDNIDDLEYPIVFWNVGGEWDPIQGLKDDLRGDGRVKKKRIEEILKDA